MQQKNIPISILSKFDDMPVLLLKGKFIIAIVIATVLLLASCSKSESSASDQILQQYFTTNLLNRNYIIQFASDNGVDITSHYTTDTFILRQDPSSLLNGPLTATRGTEVYTGTWSSNSDYSQLNIDILTPSPIPNDYIFISRSWKFTKKALPVMQLAPWGSTDPKVLYMQRL